jgi:hypothetical protein
LIGKPKHEAKAKTAQNNKRLEVGIGSSDACREFQRTSEVPMLEVVLDVDVENCVRKFQDSPENSLENKREKFKTLSNEL